MDNPINVYVDEYGDVDIDHQKDGVQTFFIVTAVFVNPDKLQAESAKIDRIRTNLFNGAEIKSQSKADKFRLQVLEAFADVDYFSFSIPVDKRELSDKSGLAYRGTFFKFINKQLYKRIFRVYDAVSVIADEHGTEKYMQSFESYIQREIPNHLFAKRKFRFANSKSENFLQVADFISGSIARFLDPGKRSDDAHKIYELVAAKSVAISPWPATNVPLVKAFQASDQISQHDEVIQRHCIKLASDFLADFDPIDKNELLQAHVLGKLLFSAQFEGDEYMPTAELINYLGEFYGLTVNPTQLRTSVISQLRDKGIIIASNSGGTPGYKIPTSASDLRDYVLHTNSIAPRMLIRLKNARDELRLVSKSQLDILESEELSLLRALVDAIEKHG